MLTKIFVAPSGSLAFGRVYILSIAFIACLFQASPGHCAIVLGNLAGSTNDNGSPSGFASSGGYSIGFTVGAAPITITSVDLRLRTNFDPGLATLELRSDVSGNPSSTALASFGNQTVTNVFSTVNFTPTAVMQLSAGSSYWLTIGTQLSAPDGLNIGSNDPSIPPTGTLATFAGLRFGFFNNQTNVVPDIPGFTNTLTFAINGDITAVPEPSSLLSIVIVCGVFEGYRRRTKRSRTPGNY